MNVVIMLNKKNISSLKWKGDYEISPCNHHIGDGNTKCRMC